tara:strand:- start:7098 stop:8993 length:1896 start_codon:yes stop_codon:yes gene_type:complete
LRDLIEKYRLLVSIGLGLLITILVLLLWLNYQQTLKKNQVNKITETAQLLTGQFQEVVQNNIQTLENFGDRLENTNGAFFDYWDSEADQIVEQDSSFLFLEWIDRSMVIRRVNPAEENQEAVGLDISELDYRRDNWLQAKRDSTINFTHWLELVQGRNAFLMDLPVYYDGRFQGTVTAGMDLSPQFNKIMQGLDQYHIQVRDAREAVFYEFGEPTENGVFNDIIVENVIRLENTNSGNWTVRVVPNQVFWDENFAWESYMNLILALILGLMVSVIFYFMEASFLAEKKEAHANEKIRALIESAPVAIYAIDTDGVVQDFWNEAAEKMLGWKQEEVLGNFMPHVEGEWADHFHGLMQKTLTDGNIRNKEIIRNRKDGTPIHLRLNVGRIVRDRANNPLMLAILEDITKEKEYQEQLENSVREKEVLLSEIHHRVKNNLAIIAGLIELQNNEIEDQRLQDILYETQNRIYSISGVHELLYNTDSFTDITFEEYAVKLVDRIQRMFQKNDQKVNIEYDFGSILFNINQAIPLGLLLNELVTNSFKHAFKDVEQGKIEIFFSQNANTIHVKYKDNGQGFDDKVFLQSKTLGITLIKTLIDQLGADYSISTENGFYFTFTFEIESGKANKGSASNL